MSQMSVYGVGYRGSSLDMNRKFYNLVSKISKSENGSIISNFNFPKLDPEK